MNNMEKGEYKPSGGSMKDLPPLTGLDMGKLKDRILRSGDEATKTIRKPIFSTRGRIYYVTLYRLTDEDIEAAADPKDKNPKPTHLARILGNPTILTPTKHPLRGLEKGKNYMIDKIDEIENSIQREAITALLDEIQRRNDIIENSPETVLWRIPDDWGNGETPKNIEETLRYYIRLGDDREYTIVASWILGTYLFPLFTAYPYLIIKGEKGSGKGTLLNILQRSCWNSTDEIITPSPSYLFRMIEDQRPTLLVDEYHRMLRGEMGKEVSSIFEAGNRRGGTVPRMEKNGDELKPVKFKVYCPKAIVTRSPVEAEDKGITITIPKIYDDQIYSKRSIEVQDDPILEKAREDIMKWVITHDEEVYGVYKSLKPIRGLGGRYFMVWAPILSIAAVAFPDKYEDIKEYAIEAVKERISAANEKESIVLHALNYLHVNEKLKDGGNRVPGIETFHVTNREIQDACEELDYERLHHKTIQSSLQNLKLIKKQHEGYYISKKRLGDLFKERGYTDSSNDEKDNSEKEEDLNNEYYAAVSTGDFEKFDNAQANLLNKAIQQAEKVEEIIRGFEGEPPTTDQLKQRMARELGIEEQEAAEIIFELLQAGKLKNEGRRILIAEETGERVKQEKEKDEIDYTKLTDKELHDRAKTNDVKAIDELMKRKGLN
ncbi:MAG TPA: hypothetical protein PKU94_08660 [Candidatus Hydrothermia bacterium]|nr:hypothetical protein [Candidatus Hydrothermia bacterium]